MSNRNFYLLRVMLAALTGTVGLATTPVQAQLTDISSSPLSSSANLSVLPNLLFTLDASGSMSFDYVADNVGVYDSQDNTTNYMCKTDANGNNACMRMDPPFSAAQVNGVGYNPQTNYRPAFKFDGTTYPKQTNWASVLCDPFNGQTCKAIYANYFSSLYNTSNNPVGNWYGSNTTLNIQTNFPEVVYCRTTGGTVTNPDQCRSNGLSNSSDVRQTGNPFRYSNARWGSPVTGAGYMGGGYPEMPAINEFWRGGAGGTVDVTTAYPHGYSTGACTPTLSPVNTCSPTALGPLTIAGVTYPQLSTFQIIPRTGTGTGSGGFDSCSGATCTTGLTVTKITSTSSLQYSWGSGPSSGTLGFGGFDMVVAFMTGGTISGTAGTSTANVPVYVTAPNHGLIAGDQIRVYNVATNIICTAGSTFTVLASPAPTTNTFAFTSTGSCVAASKTSTGFYQKTSLYNVPKLKLGGPLTYQVDPIEYCSDVALTTCQTGSGAGFTYPAPVRYCSSPFDANRWDSPTGNNRTGTQTRCQKKYDTGRGYIYARYGQFTRTDLTSAGSYGSRPTRTDCAAPPVCTGTEEMNNFANWFAYYRDRMLMMKTSAGIAFNPIDKRYRVGFIIINPGTISSSNYLKISDFDSTQKSAWYNIFYAQEPANGTPLREALARAGRHFAGRTDGINKNMSGDPVQYSCQQNFLLLTTDGYWNGNAGVQINGSTAIGNPDSDPNLNLKASNNKLLMPIWDGGTPFNPNSSDSAYSSSNTLADTALYYYQTDLRPAGSIGALGTDVSQDNVPTSDKDGANWQHMVTFGLGLADGLMEWQSTYESSGTPGDFANVKNGSGVCPWDLNKCQWPMPHPDSPAGIDDLWHAAVNGRGTYFNARDPLSLQYGLNTALNNINVRNASAAAAATSTPNITASDHTIYLSTYTTIQWNGQITAESIDATTGDIIPTPVWQAQGIVQSMVSASSDTRKIMMFSNGSPNKLKDFLYANMVTTPVNEQSWFQGKCSPLANMTQCATLAPTDLTAANDGASMVNFLRGQTVAEGKAFRDRLFSLGDTVNAVPLYVGRPRLSFGDAVTPDYPTWAATASVKNRTPALYVGANDGMLHVFNGNTGAELWAYVPRMTAQNMWKLSEYTYATKHVYFVDGSPVSGDVYDTSAGTWKTILVGGLNSGGRGYYALDVTDPNFPKALWEFCSDSTLCPLSDTDLGYSFGNPVITKRASDGRWVVLVTSGYNNVTPGTGKGFLYVLDAMTGAVLSKIGTGVGGTCVVAPCAVGADPSGLAKISAWADNFSIDNTTKWVYGTDMEGYIWKFDLTTATPTVKSLGQAKDSSGKPQPITTKVALGLVQDLYRVIFVGTGRYLGNTDLTDPATQVPPGTTSYQQSFYAFKDTDTNLGNLRTSGLTQQTLTESGTTRTVSSNTVNWATGNGWFIDFNPGGLSPGERVTVDPQLILGTVVIPTNVPNQGACSLGGDSWLYQVDYASGSYLSNQPGQIVGVKLQGQLVAGVTSFQLGNGAIILDKIGVGGGQPSKESGQTNPGGSSSRRSSWREITQ